jgi:ABC-type nitrate/sulfonate/bicarbonate transport system permease component
MNDDRDSAASNKTKERAVAFNPSPLSGSAGRPRASSHRYLSWGVAAALLVIWQAVATWGIVPAWAVPSPWEVLQDGITVAVQGYGGVTLLGHIWTSLQEIGLGFLSALVVGVPLGMMMALSPFWFFTLDPLIQFVRPIPPLAYLPLLVAWFGIDLLPKALLIFICTLPIILLAALSGVRATLPERIRVAQCLGASPRQVFWRVVLPSALPEVFTGMRVGIGVAWTCLVAAEMIAATRGLGWLILNASQELELGYVFVGIFVIGLIGYAMDLLIRLAEAWWVPWKGRA